MSAPIPRPGFIRGLGPTIRRSLATVLPGKKAAVLLTVMAVPPLLALPALDDDPLRRGEILMSLLLFLYLQFLVPVSGLLFGTGIVLDEKSGGTLPFIFTRPTPRASLVIGKYAAALLAGALVLSVSVSITLLISTGAEVKPGLAGRAFAAILLAYPAYLAAFAFLGALTRWALLGGFLYAFGLEGFLGFIPGMVREATLLHYSRSLLGEWEARKITMELLTKGSTPVAPAKAVVVLLLVAAVYLVLTMVVVAIKQFADRNPGRA